MKVKTAVWGPAGIVIAVLAGAGIYLLSRELEKRDVANARRETQTQTELLAGRQREVQDLTSRQASMQKNKELKETLTAGIARLDAENAVLQKKTEQQKGAWQEERDKFSADIEKMRQFLREKPLPLVTLQDGNVLKQVRFKAIKENMVVLEHSDGIIKVQAGTMPDDLKTRLAPDWNPELPADLEDPAKLIAMAAEAEVKAAEEAAKPPPANVRAGAAPSNFPKILEMESKIKALGSRIEQAMAAKQEQRQIYEESSNKFNEARRVGHSSNHNVARDAALDRVDLLAGQIAEAKSKLRKMQAELERLQAPVP